MVLLVLAWPCARPRCLRLLRLLLAKAHVSTLEEQRLLVRLQMKVKALRHLALLELSVGVTSLRVQLVMLGYCMVFLLFSIHEFIQSHMDIIHEFVGRLILHMHVHARLMLCLLVLRTPAQFPRSFAAVVADAARACAASVHGSAFNSGGAGGLLSVCKSTSYKLEVCSRKTVSGLAEDLRPVSEVEAEVNFRPAGGVRGQVAGLLPGRQPGTGTRKVREGAVTPSLHPKVPDTRFTSPGRVLGIRQSVGWT